jgi:hypothetical protein
MTTTMYAKSHNSTNGIDHRKMVEGKMRELKNWEPLSKPPSGCGLTYLDKVLQKIVTSWLAKLL